jgi:outer membrane protein TolC
MYEVGEGRQAGRVLRAQVEIARMSEDITRMGAMRAAAEGRLNALLNRAQETVVASPLLPQMPVDVPAIDSLQRVALSRQPMIRAGQQDLDAAVNSVDLARREIWPDLQVGVQLGQRSGEMGTERMASLMIGASLPIFARSRQLRIARRGDRDAGHGRCRPRGDARRHPRRGYRSIPQT